MSLAVTGLGLVSPLGLLPEDHAFFPRAGAVRPRASPFRNAEGEPVDARYAPFLGARLPLSERLAHLAKQAIQTALLPLAGDPLPRGASLFVVTSPPRPGLVSAEIEALVQDLASITRAADVQRWTGAAGVFGALAEARTRTQQGRPEMVLVVAVDSLIDLPTLTDRIAHPKSPWVRPSLPAGEGAAAFLVTSPDAARARTMNVLGTLLSAATAQGTSTDEDDNPVDGAAMTAVLQRLKLPENAKIGAAYGQNGVDDLRFDEWQFALARTADRFAMDHEAVTPEERTGEAGAAAGAMALAQGLAIQRHAAATRAAALSPPFVAWSVSRDGTRGAALAAGDPR